MGINYNEINTNLLRVIQNADSEQDFLTKFFAAAAQNVTWESVGSDGKTVSRTMPNVTKYMRSVNDTIYGAMKRTFYVDASAGDDANDGSESAPLRSFGRALKLLPFGGMGVIILMSDIVLKASEIIYINNLQISVRGNSETQKRKLTFDLDAGISSPLSLSNTALIIDDGCVIETVNNNGGQLCPAISAYRSSYVGFNSPKLLIGDDTYLLKAQMSSMLLGFCQDDNVVGTNAHLISVVHSASICAGFGDATINSNSIDDEMFAGLIKGIVTDTNGSVQNVISNKKLA